MAKKTNVERDKSLRKLHTAAMVAPKGFRRSVKATTSFGSYTLPFVFCDNRGRETAVALQHQDQSGTAWQKLLTHAAKLGELGASGRFHKCVLVTSGSWWSKTITPAFLAQHLVNGSRVQVITLMQAMAAVAAGTL
jgi:hypothetical protein